jgi:hypothetical protein
VNLTAWDIYWVMQLDSIGSALSIASVLFTVVGGIATVIYKFASACDDKDAREVAKGARFGIPVLALGLLSWTACTMLPSTKTAAAMVVVPALVNSEAIKKEAGDLYGLAKQALTDAVGKPEPRK